MDIRMIAMDLDGTLLQEDHTTISERTVSALRKASGRGIRIVIASGRTYLGIQNVLRQIPFADYALTSNGAAAVDIRTGEQIFYEGLPYAKWIEIYDILKEHKAVFEVYADGRPYMESCLFDRYENDMLSREFVEQLKASIIPMEDGREELKGKCVEKICALTTDPVEYPRALEKLKALEGLEMTSSIPGNLEINRAGTNKGSGLAALCRRLGVEAKQVMAFGDAGNDLEMLRFAGWSYAMENGDEDVKAAAGFVTGSNANDGVAQAVERMLEDTK